MRDARKLEARRRGTDDGNFFSQTPEPLAGVASGLNHAVAYTRGGAAYAWGWNACGQLGNGTFTSASRPLRILQGVVVTAVAVGAEHTLALASDGRLHAFGCNARGALGIGSSDLGRFPLPQVVTTPEPFVAIAAAGAHSVGLTASGGVYTWGANNQGQLGARDDRVDRGTTPADRRASLARRIGRVRESGRSGWGLVPERRAHGACSSRKASCCQIKFFIAQPTKVTNTNDGDVLPAVKLIAAGGGAVAGDAHDLKGGHTVVVTRDDVVYAWGDNSAGQLGACLFQRQERPSEIIRRRETSVHEHVVADVPEQHSHLHSEHGERAI